MSNERIVIEAIGEERDATNLIQGAINLAAEQGGGEVFLSAGRYMIKGYNTLKLKSNVSLKGVKGATIIDFSQRDDFSSSIYAYLIGGAGEIEIDKEEEKNQGNQSKYRLSQDSKRFDEDDIRNSDVKQERSYSIKRNSVDDLSEGDLIIITSDDVWNELASKISLNIGEMFIINHIDEENKRIQVKGILHENYLVEKNARAYKVNPIKNIKIEGIEFVGKGRCKEDARKDADLGLGFTYGQNITVRDCSFKSIDSKQLEFRSCYNFTVDNCYFEHDKYTTAKGATNEKQIVPEAPYTRYSGDAVQYQVRVSDACKYGTIINCVGIGGRHFFNTGHSLYKLNGEEVIDSVKSKLEAEYKLKFEDKYDEEMKKEEVKKEFKEKLEKEILLTQGDIKNFLFGVNRYITVSNCKSTNTWHAGYSTHNDGEFIKFENCIADGSGEAGFNPRSSHNIVKNCIVTNCLAGINLTCDIRNSDIENNTIKCCRVGVKLDIENPAEPGEKATPKEIDSYNKIIALVGPLDVKNINIVSNNIKECRQGISVVSGSNINNNAKVNILNNIIIDGGCDSNCSGIKVDFGKAELIIKGNVIKGGNFKVEKNDTKLQCGIYLSRLSRVVIESNYIEDVNEALKTTKNAKNLYIFNNVSINSNDASDPWNTDNKISSANNVFISSEQVASSEESQ